MERYTDRQKDLITMLALEDESNTPTETKLLIASIKFETTRDLLDKLLEKSEQK